MKKVLLFLVMFIPFLVEAKDITTSCAASAGVQSTIEIMDHNYASYARYAKGNKLKITCSEEIGNVYIVYHTKSSKGEALYNNNKYDIGENGFLHELIKLDSTSKEFEISYNEDYLLADLYIFDEEVEDYVQDWEVLTDADMMLFSTHADDEMLFFAGLLPLYVDQSYKIQVVYFTRHINEPNRLHEQLNGLWTVGVKYYPVISEFPDAFSENIEGAIKNLNNAGYTVDDALLFQVENIRKYKPEVIVGHDEKGEYSHGQHILNTDLLKKAYEKAADKDYDEKSIEKYGTHEIKKLYLHLYDKNPITLDLDKKLNSFGGKSAYEVAKEGYAYHYSQQYTWFTAWLTGYNKLNPSGKTEADLYTSAKQIETYSPMNYGLFYSSVGEDKKKNDIFENVLPDIDLGINTTVKIESGNDHQALNIKDNQMTYLIVGASMIILSSVGLTLVLKRKKRY